MKGFRPWKNAKNQLEERWLFFKFWEGGSKKEKKKKKRPAPADRKIHKKNAILLMAIPVLQKKEKKGTNRVYSGHRKGSR